MCAITPLRVASIVGALSRLVTLSDAGPGGIRTPDLSTLDYPPSPHVGKRLDLTVVLSIAVAPTSRVTALTAELQGYNRTSIP